MAEVILVRHAPTSWTGQRYAGRADPALNRRGRVVAAGLAAELAADIRRGTMIVSSPARRARETAAAIGRGIPGSRVEVDDRWSEVEFGIADGLTFAELAGVAPDLATRLAAGDVDIDWPGGETAASLAERVGSAWRDLCLVPGQAIVVSHAGPLRVAIALASDIPVSGVVLPEAGAFVRVAARSVRRDGPGPVLRFGP